MTADSSPTEQVHTEIHDAHGATNTGPGHQFNFNLPYAEWCRKVLPEAAGAARRPVFAEHLSRLRAQFEPPAGFDFGHLMLASDRAMVVLSGARGSGRRTAARMLLCPPHEAAGALDELATDDESTLDPAQVIDGDRLLLDLSELDHGRFAWYQRQLPGLASMLPARRARLVVVIGDDQDEWLSDDFQPYKIRIERPDPRRVLVKHLAYDTIELPDGAANEPACQSLLATASMSTVARLAGLVVEERRRRPQQPRQWLSAAVKATTGYSADVRGMLSKHRDGPTRALLLTAAGLEGAQLDAVSWAEHKLLRIVDFPEAETHWLEGEGLLTRLDGLGVLVDPATGRLGFRSPGYAEAVVTRYWDDYAGLRHQLGKWLVAVAEGGPLTDSDRERVVERLIDQLLRAGQTVLLNGTARAWATRGPEPMRRLAYNLLERAILDDDHGYKVRRQVYDWASDRTLAVPLANTVLALCDKVLLPRYPNQAIVRLRLLTLHTNAFVADAARDILTGLAKRDAMYRRILALLAQTRKIDYTLLARLLDPSVLLTGPSPLLADRWIRGRVTACWGVVMDDGDYPGWANLVWPWLDQAAATPHTDLLDVLVAAASPDSGRLGRLFVVASGWSDQGPRTAASNQVVTMLRALIDRSQGIKDLPYMDSAVEVSS